MGQTGALGLAPRRGLGPMQRSRWHVAANSAKRRHLRGAGGWGGRFSVVFGRCQERPRAARGVWGAPTLTGAWVAAVLTVGRRQVPLRRLHARCLGLGRRDRVLGLPPLHRLGLRRVSPSPSSRRGRGASTARWHDEPLRRQIEQAQQLRARVLRSARSILLGHYACGRFERIASPRTPCQSLVTTRLYSARFQICRYA